MIKLLAVDLDGTCLTSDVTVTPETREALEQAIDKGVVVVPATGRTLSTVPEEIIEIPGLEYILTSSGASIKNLKTDKIVYQQSIPEELLEEIVEIINDYDPLMEVYHAGTAYSRKDKFEDLAEYVSEPAYWDYFKHYTHPVSKEELDELIFTQPIEKINIRLHVKDNDKREEVIERLRSIPGLDIVDQAEGNIEITNEEANKGESLAAIANYLGIDCSEVMTIGDSNNDIPMLTFADFGVAMGQAEDNVKASANYVTDTNDNNGVAKAVKKFILDVEPEKIPESTEDWSQKLRQVHQGN